MSRHTQIRYRVKGNKLRRLFKSQMIIKCFLLGLMVLGLAHLIPYCIDLISSRRTANELKQVYNGEQEGLIEFDTQDKVCPTEEPEIESETVRTETETPIQMDVQSSVKKLQEIPYPNNAGLKIDNRFKQLRKENRDIVGWLRIGQELEEAVVQRDNVFYLTHDAKGKNNVNGAIFLDDFVSLKTRPYSLVLYGHNMKTGAMFGCLRNYEKPSYYHNASIISFDTMYETGEYAVFAVGQVSMKENDSHYLDFFSFYSVDPETRMNVIDTLVECSIYKNQIDVCPEDQLLVLVTCTADDEERRVVAARRVREGESIEELQRLINYSDRK